MKYVFRVEGGLGKNFALLGVLSKLPSLPTKPAFIIHYQQVYNYYKHKNNFDFLYNWNIIIPSPYDIFQDKFKITLLEPYSKHFFDNKKHIIEGYAEEIDKILGTNTLEKVKIEDYFEWEFDDSIIQKKLDDLMDVLSKKNVIVMELQNRAHNITDPRSLNIQQINEIVKHFYNDYNIVIVSSIPYNFNFINNTFYINNSFIGSKRKCSIFYIYDVLELAYILRTVAKSYISIDSFLPYLAHTEYVRKNKLLVGTVLFIATHPDNFGFPENKNILLNPQPSSRTFGLGAWDGFTNIKDLKHRDTIQPNTILSLL